MRQKYRIVLGTTTFSKPMRLNANTAPITSNIGLTKIPVIWIHNRAHTETHSLYNRTNTDNRSLYNRTRTDSRSLYNRTHTDSRSLKIRAHTDTRSLYNWTNTDSRSLYNRANTDSRSLKIRAHTDTRSLYNRTNTDSRSLCNRTNTDTRSLYNRTHTDTHHFIIGLAQIPAHFPLFFLIGLTQIPGHFSFCFFKSGSHRYPSLHNGAHKDTYHFIIGITKIPFASQIGMTKIPLGFGFYFHDTPSRRATISTQEKDNKDTKCLLLLNAKRCIILDKLRKVRQTINPPADR